MARAQQPDPKPPYLEGKPGTWIQMVAKTPHTCRSKLLECNDRGKQFDYKLFHAVLTYSNWEHLQLCDSESYEALATGLKDALYGLAAFPGEFVAIVSPQRSTTCLATRSLPSNIRACSIFRRHGVIALGNFNVTVTTYNPTRLMVKGKSLRCKWL